MAYVDSEVCIKANCPFVDKKTGICSKALVLRKPKSKVCVSNVSIKVEGKKTPTL